MSSLPLAGEGIHSNSFCYVLESSSSTSFAAVPLVCKVEQLDAAQNNSQRALSLKMVYRQV